MDLERAIQMAVNAHTGQVDKAGQPYILHPLRVMMAVPREEKYQIVGVLHDVLEDTNLTEEQLLEEGFSLEIVEAIFALTRQDGELYKEFIERISMNEIATVVKLTDLLDNMRPDRNPEPHTPETTRRLSKYRKAHTTLLGVFMDREIARGIQRAVSQS
jgi:guanosine-3',5'-bis(diphosphate) 3'-pyrophosphohydrolase